MTRSRLPLRAWLASSAPVRWIACVLGHGETGPLATYCLKAWVVAVVPYLGVCAVLPVVARALGAAESWYQPPRREATGAEFIDSVVLGPMIETVLLACVAKAVGILVRRKAVVAGVTAASLAGLHGFVSPGWGLSVLWPFYVLASAYLVWVPRRRGFLAAWAPHASWNLAFWAVLALATSG